MSGDWTSEENDKIVADYFAMLGEDISGRRYNKAARNRQLQAEIGRSSGSIEFKHQNISAVLKGLGEDWVRGYKPAFNFQASLVDAVIRWLDGHPDWTISTRAAGREPLSMGFGEEGCLFIGPPPTQRNAPPPPELEQMMRVATKYDVAERDARNRALGRAGEARVLAYERANLRVAGRDDLAEQVRWIADLDGDGAGYDILSFEADGRERLIEVKTTNGWERTPFQISRNEGAVSEARSEEWRLIRLWNFARNPQAFELRPPLRAHVSLMATSYQATPN